MGLMMCLRCSKEAIRNWVKIPLMLKEERTSYKDPKKKNCKALFYIQQSVDTNKFEKISKVSTSNQAWDISTKYHTGGDK